jgi:hypothetical protein
MQMEGQALNTPLMDSAESIAIARSVSKKAYVHDADQFASIYGVEGLRDGETCKIPSWHNSAYATGFKWMQLLCWYVLAPLSIPMAFVCGIMVAGYASIGQMMGIKPFWNLVGDIVGQTVLAVSGKREYYERKQAYYEVAAWNLQLQRSQQVANAV